MKKGILILLLLSSVFTNAQSLKEALYSGKLKNDAGTVIRKGEDISTKMDTTRKQSTVDSTKLAMLRTDSLHNDVTTQTTSVSGAATMDSTSATQPVNAPQENAAKDNDAVLKEFIDGITEALKAEVLSSKKVKSGSYYVLVSYSIGTDGQFAIGDVFVSPENDFLQEQVKKRLSIDVPRLSPVLSSSGKPRKVNTKLNFTITKE